MAESREAGNVTVIGLTVGGVTVTVTELHRWKHMTGNYGVKS